jgi:serine/threonine protein kinase
LIGQILGLRYELTEELSISPIFESYVARDRVRGGEVCLRIVRKPFSAEPAFLETLASVVERNKLLDHPNIARMTDIDEHEGQPFVVCELVRGSNLAEKIRRVAPFSPAVACELGIGICEALEHGSLRGMPHGDLCSDHVITSMDGRLAVIDFGLWECYGKSASAGGMVLSRMAPYLAPEIIEGDLPTPASDVYALGVILFELLTARLPYAGQTPMSILAKHSTQAVPSVRSLNAAVPLVLDEIVAKALAKNPGHRYSSAVEMLGDLRTLRDALRFGRQLNWPLHSPVQQEAAPVMTYAEKAAVRRAEPLIQTESRPNTKQSKAPAPKPARLRAASDDDVPGWLKALVYLFSGMAVALVVGWMVFNVTKKKEVEVPNYVGMTVAEARLKIKSLKLNLAVEGEEFNDKYPQPDTIISMNPAPKMHVREGETIRVWRSKGAPLVDVPDVRGMTLSDAKRKLEAYGLVVSQRVTEAQSRTLDKGLVVETDPKYGERVDRNTTIELTLSSGKSKPEEETKPDALTPNTWTLRFKVREGDTDVMVRVEMTDGSGEKKIVFEEPKPGGDSVFLENIEGVGKTATFRIYFDDLLYRTIKREGNNP